MKNCDLSVFGQVSVITEQPKRFWQEPAFRCAGRSTSIDLSLSAERIF
jgi:hypothetical protein